MKFNELDIKKRRKITRAGRGIAAGRGKTAGRGTKGQKSRTGGNIRPGFEGGQTSLVGRLPKLRGFKSHRAPKTVVYTSQVEALKDKKVDNFTLLKAKVITDAYVDVKLVVNGDLTSSKEVELQAASASAIEMIQKAGGSFSKVPKPQRQKKTSDTNAK